MPETEAYLSMKLLSSAVACDGGSIWLALEKSEGDVLELKLDRKIGSKTINRIFVNNVLVNLKDEESWVKTLNETLVGLNSEPEIELVNRVIKSIVKRVEL